jgi:hypothetical protein
MARAARGVDKVAAIRKEDRLRTLADLICLGRSLRCNVRSRKFNARNLR